MTELQKIQKCWLYSSWCRNQRPEHQREYFYLQTEEQNYKYTGHWLDSWLPRLQGTYIIPQDLVKMAQNIVENHDGNQEYLDLKIEKLLREHKV